MRIPKEIRELPWPEEYRDNNTRIHFRVTLDLIENELLVATFVRNRNHQVLWTGVCGPDFRLVCSKAPRDAAVLRRGEELPERPMEGAVRLVVKWCFPRGEHRDGEYRTTRPDTDNLQKLLKDCMTKTGFWRDDAQVASEIVEKFWAEVPGIYIRVERLEESCRFCRWWAKDAAVCCNSDSEWCADFTGPEDGCPAWEGEK